MTTTMIVGIKRNSALITCDADSVLGRALVRFVRDGSRPSPTHGRGLRSCPSLARFVKKCAARRQRDAMWAMAGETKRAVTAHCSDESFAQLATFASAGVVDEKKCGAAAETMMQLYQFAYEIQCVELMSVTSAHISDLCSTNYLGDFDAEGQLTVL